MVKFGFIALAACFTISPPTLLDVVTAVSRVDGGEQRTAASAMLEKVCAYPLNQEDPELLTAVEQELLQLIEGENSSEHALRALACLVQDHSIDVTSFVSTVETSFASKFRSHMDMAGGDTLRAQFSFDQTVGIHDGTAACYVLSEMDVAYETVIFDCRTRYTIAFDFDQLAVAAGLEAVAD